ncbi:MAG: T9SS type A sorting domain-containing protein [Bacteroidia bacterium]|nr:T9SS type A sorting domain-containing protein [Bacteroidia bacterium]
MKKTKRLLYLITLIYSVCFMNGQSTCPSSLTTNCELVCNGSFEGLSANITSFGQIGNCTGWTTATAGTPDAISVTSTLNLSTLAPCNLFGYENSMSSGGTYAGIKTVVTPSLAVDNEYLQTQLVNTMKAGYVYSVSLWVSRAEFYQFNTPNISVYFSNSLVSQAGFGTLSITPVYSETNTTILNNTSGWMSISFTYTSPSGTENYLLIGSSTGTTSSTTAPPSSVSGCTNNIPSGSNTFGYMYIDNVSIKQLTPQIVTPSICSGMNGSYSLLCNPTGTANYSWAWGDATTFNTTSTTANLTYTTGGVYTITLTTTSGTNTYVSTQTLTVGTFSTSLTYTNTCANGLLSQFTAASTCTTATMNYTFYFGDGTNSSGSSPTASHTYSAGGVYSATLVSTNGIASYTTTQNVNILGATGTLVLTPSSYSVCPNANVSITASGGSAGTYTFLPGGFTTNPTVFNPTVNTTYTVNGKATNNCPISQTITIYTYTNDITASASTYTICQGVTTTLTATGGSSYTWNPTGTVYTATYAVTPSITITYTLTGITSVNSCLKTKTLTITVKPAPSLTISPSSGTICSGSSIVLTASGASTYTWQPLGVVNASVSVSPTVSTTYSVIGTGTNSCSSTKTVSIVVNPLPSISCATNKTLVCQGSTSTLSATGASTYTWSPAGLTGASVVVTSTANPTNYTVTGTSALGCTNTCVVTQSVFTSSTSFFTVTASPSATICNSGGTTTLTATGSPSNYIWTPGSLVQNTLSITSPGIYTATSTNSIGCVGSKTFEVFGTSDAAFFNAIPPVCGIQSINLLSYAYPAGPGTFSVNGTQISGSTYTFSSASSTAYTVGFTYTGSNVLCGYTATYVLTTNTACCTSTLTQITSTLITGTTIITGGKAINQNITVGTGADVTFNGGEFIFAPNVQIIVQNGGTFRVEGAHLYACKTEMWEGVTVQFGGRAILNTNTVTGMSTFIEDAKTAINIEPITSPPGFSAPIETNNTIFNKNYIAIKINTVTLSGDLDVDIKENVFTCRTITFTPSSWPTTSTVTPGLRSASSGTATTGLTAPYPLQSFSYTTCLSPYSGLPSNAGVRLTNVSYSTSYVYGVQIGESNSIDDQTDFNLFDALAYGIYADESNVSVINNVFQNTRQYNTPPPKPKTKGGSAIYYYVNTDYFRQLNLTNTISSYSLTPSVGNRFWDCHRAVDATNAYILNMEYATVRSTQNTSGGTGFLAGNTGVVSTTNRFSYNFRNNEFTNIRNPINIPIVANTYNYTGTPTVGIYANNFAILNNYFGPVTTTTASTSGQYINNAITISSPNSGNWNKVTFTGLSVMNNQINRVYRGISINGMDSYSTAVSNNTISMVDDGLFNSTQRGIELVNTQNSVVITTNTLSAANTTNTLATLVYLGNNIGTTSPSVTCNNLSSSYQGFEFNNDNRNTFWRGNLMQTHARGMVISNSGTIGVQGSSGAPIDNQWNGTWTGTNYGTFMDNSDASYSKLYTRAGSPYQAPANFGNNANTFWYSWGTNTISTTGAFSCGGGGGGGGSGRYSSGAPRVYEVTNNYDQSSYKSGGGTDSIDTDEEYMAVNNSYRILEANPDLISNSPSNAAFYNNYANTSIGKFAQAEKQAYNGANTQANATSSSVSSKVSVEDNYKTYFALYDKYKSGNLDETDLASLNSLANLCPGIDGPVIYQARALYQVVTKDVIVFKENCEQISNARQSKKSSTTPSVANWDVHLYPNPTSGELNIVSKNNSEQLMVIIKDATGKIVNQNNLQVSDFISNLTLNLENGLYLITITNNKNETTTKKLVIAK